MRYDMCRLQSVGAYRQPGHASVTLHDFLHLQESPCMCSAAFEVTESPILLLEKAVTCTQSAAAIAYARPRRA